MSYEERLNRFKELRQALQKMADKSHIQQSLRPVAEEAGNRSLAELREAAPVGQEEPSYPIQRPDGSEYIVSHGRPSIRLFGSGMTLFDQWGAPEIEPTNDGMSFSILSNAPHMGILLDGSPPHDIPKRPGQPISFFCYSLGAPVIFDYWRAYVIKHPGFPPSNFVRETLNRGLGAKISALNMRGLQNVRKPLTKFFG